MTTTKRLSLFRCLLPGVAVLVLSACSVRPEVLASPAPDAVLNVPKAAKRIAPSTLPLMTTPGTWVSPPRGPLFEVVDTLDPRHAMVYVYRPPTSWEDLEVQAPSFFVNGKKVFGLKSGSYTWLELHAGDYQLYAKRPLFVLFIKKIFELDLNVVGGKTYFLRYSEDAPFSYADYGLDPDDFQQDGFMQEVPENIALHEIASMKLDHPGLYFAATGRVTDPRWAPFESFPKTGVSVEDGADGTSSAASGLWWRAKSFFGSLF